MPALAAMCSHVPNEGEQMLRYYGYYSPAFGGICREKRMIGSCFLSRIVGLNVHAMLPMAIDPKKKTR